MRWIALVLLLACTDHNPAALSEGDLAAAEWPREGEADCSPSPEGAPACCLPREGECPKGGEWMDLTGKAWVDGFMVDSDLPDDTIVVRGCYAIIPGLPVVAAVPGKPQLITITPVYALHDGGRLDVVTGAAGEYTCSAKWAWTYQHTGMCQDVSGFICRPGGRWATCYSGSGATCFD